MNETLQQLLGQLGSSPNWQYQLGLAQIQPQEQQTAANYLLGQGQLGLGTLQANQNYSLGQGQNQNQAASIANQFSLGQDQNKNASQQTSNQLSEYLKQLDLQSQNQNWEQQFAQQQNQQQQNGMTAAQLNSAAVMAALNGGSKGGATAKSMNGEPLDTKNMDFLSTTNGRNIGGNIYDPQAMGQLYYWMAHGH